MGTSCSSISKVSRSLSGLSPSYPVKEFVILIYSQLRILLFINIKLPPAIIQQNSIPWNFGIKWKRRSNFLQRFKFYKWWERKKNRSGLKIRNSVGTWYSLLVAETQSNSYISWFDLVSFNSFLLKRYAFFSKNSSGETKTFTTLFYLI